MIRDCYPASREPNDFNKILRVTIPDGYPSIPPIIQNQSFSEDITEDKSDGMEMAEYDEDEDFLKVQEQYFDERLDSLGPDLGKTSFILDGSKKALSR